MPTVLIVIDHTTRELFGGMLLAHYLERLGCAATLCNTVTFGDYFARDRPDAVVWPNPHWDLTHLAGQTLIFIAPTESSNGQRDGIAWYAGTPTLRVYPQPVTRFFCWGSGMRDVLFESGVWSAEQLVVTGSPLTDHWLLPPAPAAGARRAGITTTFRTISNGVPHAKTNVFEQLDNMERFGGDGQYYLPPEHAESWMFVEVSAARVILALVRRLAVEGSTPVEVRPHPWELLERYEYFGRFGDRVSVRKEGTISEWFERIFILFTFMSASSLDAIVRGMPVISIKGLMDPDARKKMPRPLQYTYEEFLWPLESVEQAAEYVQEAASGRLAPCRDEAAVGRFLEEYFDYPRRRPAAAVMAEQIARVIEAEGPRLRRARGSRPGRGPIDQYARLVPLGVPSLAAARYLHGRLPGNSDLRFTYWPWQVRERRLARRAAAAVAARFPDAARV